MKRIVTCLLLMLFLPIANANTNNTDSAVFQSLFANWTQAFNQKNPVAACELFASSVRADYRGIPTKNYRSICNGFKKIFQEKNKTYHYQFKLHQVFRSENLAAVRITWYLQISENGRKTITTQDEGIDILELNHAGKWQIVNYLAYDKPVRPEEVA